MDNRKSAGTAATVILCAILARVLGKAGFYPVLMGLVRTLLYISFYLWWGISIRKRVLQPQVRRYLSAIVLLMIFWFTVRTCKYYFVHDPNIMRYLWYSYYIPLLFIPMLAVFVAMFLGRPESFRLSKWTRLLYIPTVVLALFVLSNDLHQCVFSFPMNEIWADTNNTVEAGYFVVLGWEILCGAFAILTILFKNRRHQQGRNFPVIILLCSILYALIYISGVEWMQMIAGDIAAAQCLFYAAIIESCLKTGLISTNTGYDTLFASVSLPIHITDEKYQVCYSSAAAVPLPKETMRATEKGGYLWNETTFLKGYPIRGGHAIWLEDISELLRVKEELKAVKEELEEHNEILRDQYRRDAKRYRLEEQNRLYDLAQRDTQKQLRELDVLSNRFSKEKEDSLRRRKLLLRILVLATYIKRHKDMVICSDRSMSAKVNLLESALRESCSNLSIAGIGGNLYVPCSEGILPMKTVLDAYDLFENALEASLDTLQYYFVSILENETGTLCMYINLECDANLFHLSEKYEDTVVEQDENCWFVTHALDKRRDDV